MSPIICINSHSTVILQLLAKSRFFTRWKLRRFEPRLLTVSHQQQSYYPRKIAKQQDWLSITNNTLTILQSQHLDVCQSSRSHNMFQDGDWQAATQRRLMAPPRCRPCLPHARRYMTSNAIVPSPSSHDSNTSPPVKTLPPYRNLVAWSILQSLIDRLRQRRHDVMKRIRQVYPRNYLQGMSSVFHRSTTGALHWQRKKPAAAIYSSVNSRASTDRRTDGRNFNAWLDRLARALACMWPHCIEATQHSTSLVCASVPVAERRRALWH